MDVNLLGSGPNENIEGQIDPTFQALRVNLRPLEYNQLGLIGGHFAMAATFSNTAGSPAAGSQLFSMRWADTRILYVLKKVVVSASTTTAFGTAQAVDVDIIKATSFSSNPSGGTTITPGTTMQKARSSFMNGSLLGTEGAMQISSGTALTSGTQTLDSQPFGYSAVLASTAIGTIGVQTLYQADVYNGMHPMIFSANEGFVIRNGIALGATGVVKFGFQIVWVEVPSY